MDSHFWEREVIYIYAFYVDVFFVQNFCLNAMVLGLAAMFRKRAAGSGRILLAAFLGTAAETLALLVLQSYLLFLLASYLAVLPAMTRFACGKGNWRTLAADYLTCFLFSVMLGGMATALENLTGIRSPAILTAGASFLFAWFGVRFLYGQYGKQKRLYPVRLQRGERHFEGKGLLDTGNVLTEPLSHRAVHIISGEAARELALTECEPDYVIPFSSLGREDGALAAYQLERLTVWRGRERAAYDGALVGVAEDSLLAGREYQVILHSKIFQERGMI